jgi:hypothetical protein
VLKKFFGGFLFGLGAVFAVALVGYVIYLLKPSEEPVTAGTMESLISWQDLEIEEKLEQASALYLIRYRPSEDGLMEAYIADIYLKHDSVEASAKIGERRRSSDFYSSGEQGFDRNGAVVFLAGSPATERTTHYLYDNRTAGGRDMPLEILIRKFKSSEAS